MSETVKGHDIFTIIPFSNDLKNEWDRFVDSSKNGTFLLKRDYMDYHSDRFIDNSLIFLRNNVPYSLLPACKIDNKLYSHAGLTYGGMVMNRKCTTEGILKLFLQLKDYLKQNNIDEIIYKPTPYIYHSIPADEDLYAIFRLNARLSIRNVSTTILLKDRIKFRNIRKTGIKKAAMRGLIVRECNDFKTFWTILTTNLQNKYEASPVHSVMEIERLSRLFPNEIKLFCAFDGENMEAGVVIYVSTQVAHCQYISATPYGKATGALDLIFDTLLNTVFSDKKYFDFGTSNENGGRFLNESLIYQKEGFGGRAICYDTYTIPLNSIR